MTRWPFTDNPTAVSPNNSGKVASQIKHCWCNQPDCKGYWRCSLCGGEHDTNQVNCPSCEASFIQPGMTRCASCGFDINNWISGSHCPNCLGEV